IKGIVALSGRLMEESKKHIIKNGAAPKLKVFIGHGNSDNVISVAESEAANVFLKSKQFSSITFNKYEMPHSINSAELNDIKTWLSTNLEPNKKSSEKK